MSPQRILRCAVLTLALASACPSAGFAQSSDVDERLQILAEELARLREQMAIPETDEQLTSLYGMGPAASKVYGARQGVSLGGYGEFYFASPLEQTDETGAVNTADFYRFISYFGYKFSDSIVMNTEIEFEHATTSKNHAGDAGSVSVEFSYLDFLIADEFNVRGGNLLIPVGIVNEMHEPPFYRGNFRPTVEQRIIPSTWRELGLGAHGTVGERVRYTAYIVNGLNGAKFDSKGVRSGRQKGNRALWEDVAGVVAISFDHEGMVRVGGSIFAGGADHGLIVDENDAAISVSNSIFEAHAQVRKGGFEGRALFAHGKIDGAKELSGVIFPDADGLVPEAQTGFYVEAAFDVAPFLLGEDTSTGISPWIRFESYDLHAEVPAIDGLAANASLDVDSVTAGVNIQPHPNVVIKLDYVHTTNAADDPTSDEARLGAGFVF